MQRQGRAMTIAEFCSTFKCTHKERIALAYHLAAIRAEEIFTRFNVNSLKQKYKKTTDSMVQE